MFLDPDKEYLISCIKEEISLLKSYLTVKDKTREQHKVISDDLLYFVINDSRTYNEYKFDISTEDMEDYFVCANKQNEKYSEYELNKKLKYVLYDLIEEYEHLLDNLLD